MNTTVQAAPPPTFQPRVVVPRRGLLLVVSSPSGAGKTTLCKRLLAADANIMMSVSATTRPKRDKEVDGRDYHFYDRARFIEAVEAGAFLEHAEVFGNLYGTPRAQVDAWLGEGRDVLFDVDWQGAQQLRAAAPHDVVSVFILPPSIEALAQRLNGRGQDSADVVARRMARAADEISHWSEYDFVIVNDDLDASETQLKSVLEAERARRTRQTGMAAFVETRLSDRSGV